MIYSIYVHPLCEVSTSEYAFLLACTVYVHCKLCMFSPFNPINISLAICVELLCMYVYGRFVYLSTTIHTL